MLNVDKSREGLYLFLFSILSIACLTGLILYEVTDRTEDSLLSTAVAVGRGMGTIVIAVAAFTVTVLEGYAMLAERYLKRRHEEGRREGRQEGHQEVLRLLREKGLLTDEDARRLLEVIDTLEETRTVRGRPWKIEQQEDDETVPGRPWKIDL